MIEQTYTTNPYSQRVSELRSQVGDNPAAIAQAFAQNATQTSQPLQQTIQGQGDAISQLAELDKKLASQYQGISQSAQQQTQNVGAMYRAAGQMSAYDPNNPQEFINRGPAQLDLNAFTKQYAPDTGLISPFAVSQSADVQSSGQRQIYDLASQQRGSLERSIGTEAANIAKIAEYENQQKAIEEAKKEAEYNRAIELAKITGVFTDPFTGVSQNVSAGTKTATEREQDRIIGQVESDVANGVTIEDLITRYKDSVSYNDLLNIYNKGSRYGEAKKGDDFYRKIYEGTATSGSFSPQELVSKTTIGKVGETAGFLKDLQDIQSLLGESGGYLSDLGVGKTGFLSQFAGARGKYGNVRAAIDSLRAKVKKKTYGSAVSEQEMKDAEKWLPGTGSQESVNLTKIQSIIDSKKNEVASLLMAEGLNEDQINTYFNQLGINSGLTNTSETQTTTPTQGEFNVDSFLDQEGL